MQSQQKQEMEGGMRKPLSAEALAKAKAWREEVKAIMDSRKISFKEALIVASELRKKTPGYKTVHQKYLERLAAKRDPKKTYKPVGHKLKKPLTLTTAQKVLLDYYRQRALNGSIKKPLTALRRNIGSCRKDPKKILTPCEADAKNRPIVTAECKESYMFRPGQGKKSGPSLYKMKGLTGLCGKANLVARKATPAYQRKRFIARGKKVVLDWQIGGV